MLNTPLLIQNKETNKNAILIDHVIFSVPFGSGVRVENYYIIADVDSGNMSAITEEYFLKAYKVIQMIMPTVVQGLTKGVVGGEE